MSRYLTVKNWEEFQHYKDRCPPWIKLHRSLLDDYEFSCLQDASKAHLMLIWVLASQQNGRIPNDPEYLKNKLGLQKAPDLENLINHGFLCMEQDASNALAEGKQNARLEEKRREDKYKVIRPEEIPEKIWSDFLEIRKAKKAPLTETALNGIAAEAAKAGFSLREALETCCNRGWQGFEAKWVDKKQERRVAL